MTGIAVLAENQTSIAVRFREVRAGTEILCEPLEVEDYVVSSMPDVSPTKWHLAHTSWFFETFLLGPHAAGYVSLDPRYAFLFNSYYVQAGERHCRAQRGLVTRPTVREVFDYRAHVDEHVVRFVDGLGEDRDHPAWAILELGLQHEQQHQELLMTDIKHVLWTNPLRPVYQEGAATRRDFVEQGWYGVGEGIYQIGHDGDGFSFDNEGPPHRVFVDDFRVSNRLVTNGEYLEFIEDGGYHAAPLWLSSGWSAVQEQAWEAPLYWSRGDDGWDEFTFSGDRPLDLSAPVSHVSYFEADAFARWAGHALPTEQQWEIASRQASRMDGDDSPLSQLFGQCWQWTQSAYTAYPKYRPSAGAIGEYNGKWMADQWVLRGSSLATPYGHERLTYRNFFPSDARWQFTGIRLVEAA